jgi:hypothetical protein
MDFTIDTHLAIGGIVLGVIAITMATPPLLQMIWGRPKLEIGQADPIVADNHKMLFIMITNIPVTNRFLKFLGVEREIGHVGVTFDIRRIGGEYISRGVTASLLNRATHQGDITAEAHPGVPVYVRVISHGKVSALFVDNWRNPLPNIPPGFYEICANIRRGDKNFLTRMEFTIGDNCHQTSWKKKE